MIWQSTKDGKRFLYLFFYPNNLFPTTLSEQTRGPFLSRNPPVENPFCKYHWCCITVLRQRACVHFSIYGSNSDSLRCSTEDSGMSLFSMWKGRLMKANTPVEYNSLSLCFFYTSHVALFKRTGFTSNWTELTGHHVTFYVCPLVPPHWL